jgi:hypothetical protein
MATLTAKVGAGEVCKPWPFARVEPQVRHGGNPAGAATASATADANGLVSFTAQPSRIEFAIQRPNGLFVKVMDSTTRGGHN